MPSLFVRRGRKPGEEQEGRGAEELVQGRKRRYGRLRRHEARYGEELGLQLFHDREEGCWYATGHRADGPCFEAQVVLNDTEQSEDSVR